MVLNKYLVAFSKRKCNIIIMDCLNLLEISNTISKNSLQSEEFHLVGVLRCFCLYIITKKENKIWG